MPVCRIEGVCNLNCILEHLLRRQWPLPQPVGQRLTLYILHNQVIDALLVTDVVECADMWMIERGNGTGLALEAFTPVGIARKMLGKNLDRYRTIEPRIFRAIHLAHTARPDRGDDLVRTEARASGERHS